LLISGNLPRLPRMVDNSDSGDGWPMYRNDKWGCCTCVTAAHMTQLHSIIARRTPTVPTDADVLAFYQRVTELEGGRFDPISGANDNGAIELDLLNQWRRYPIGGQKIFAFAAVEPDDEDLVRAGIYVFGGLYIGIALPLSARRQLAAKQPWEVVADPATSIPGSWGGHAVCVLAYDPEGLTIATWGTTQRMTWGFWHRYVDESYVAAPMQWKTRGAHPAFNWNELMGNLDALGTLNPDPVTP